MWLTAPGIEVIGYTPVSHPGNPKPLTVDLEPGYVVLSNGGDYQYGM